MVNSGLTLSADVLKAGHHGSRTSSSPDFLKAVSPSWQSFPVEKAIPMAIPMPRRYSAWKMLRSLVPHHRLWSLTVTVDSHGNRLQGI